MSEVLAAVRQTNLYKIITDDGWNDWQSDNQVDVDHHLKQYYNKVAVWPKGVGVAELRDAVTVVSTVSTVSSVQVSFGQDAIDRTTDELVVAMARLQPEWGAYAIRQAAKIAADHLGCHIYIRSDK